jgi:hypothetical protein
MEQGEQRLTIGRLMFLLTGTHSHHVDVYLPGAFR